MPQRSKVEINRRDQIMIVRSILARCLEPRRITHIMYYLNMSYIQCMVYLKIMIKSGYITRDGKFYYITTAGKSALHYLRMWKREQ